MDLEIASGDGDRIDGGRIAINVHKQERIMGRAVIDIDVIAVDKSSAVRKERFFISGLISILDMGKEADRAIVGLIASDALQTPRALKLDEIEGSYR